MATYVFSSFFLVFCKCFKRILQVYQLFWKYVASVLPRCCKNRSDFAHIAMRMRSRVRHEQSLCAVGQRECRPGGAGPTWAHEMQAQDGGMLARA
jgi:hypothetical protein